MITHQRQPYLGMEKSVVIGIDVGTTLSGVSYALLEPGKVPRIQSVMRFSGQRKERGKSKVPSVVCYDQDGNVVAAGPETDPEVNPMVSEMDDSRLAEWFKLYLCPETQVEKMWPSGYPQPTEGTGENDSFGIERGGGGKVEGNKGTKGERDGSKEGLRNTPSREVAARQLPNKRKIPRPVTNDFKLPDQIFTDFLQYLFKSAKKYITETERKSDPTFTWSSIERNTYFVLTHPNGWGIKQQSQMRDAAIAANLVNRSTVMDRITFVSEGKANFCFCLDKHPELYQESGGILVIDCGGGTIGLSAYSQTKQGDFKGIASPDCLLQGSLFVTSRARDYFKGRFKGSKFGTDNVVETMTRAFDKPEGVKCLFRCSDRPYFVKFGGLRDNDQKYGICGGKFKVEGAQLAKFFEPAVESIIAGIENQCMNTDIKCVLLVGGFGRSQYLYAKLSDHFNSNGIVVLRPDMTHPNKAVADGAVSWYLNHYANHSYEVLKAGHLLDPADPDHLNCENTHANGKSYLSGIFSTILEWDSEVWAKIQFHQAHGFMPIRQSTAWTTVNALTNRGKATDMNQLLPLNVHPFHDALYSSTTLVQLLQPPACKVAHLNHLLVEEASSPIEAKQKQLIHGLLATNQRQREEIKQMKTARPINADSEQIHMLAPPTIVNKPDGTSMPEVAELLRILNTLIEQASSLIADSLSYRRQSVSSKELEDVFLDYIGPWLCNDLRSKQKRPSMEPDHLITQIALQSALVNACSYIINDGITPSDCTVTSQIDSEGQTDANAWTARKYTAMPQSKSWEINRKYLTEIALKLITIGEGSLESGRALPPQYHEILDEIVERSLELHKAISEEVLSTIEPATYNIPHNPGFAPFRMEDLEWDGDRNETRRLTQDSVICIVEMGLENRKREKSGSREEISLEFQKVISKDVISVMEPVTCSEPVEAEVDPSQMEDTEEGGDETKHTQDTVALECKKRKESESRKEASLELRKIISEDVASMIESITKPYNTEFDFSRVEDTEGGRDETKHIQDTVACTLEMGLEHQKRKESGSGEKASLELQKVISEDVASMTELVTYTVPCDTEFDSSQMEDAEADENETGSRRVISTMKMTEPDPSLMARIAFQWGLVNGCSYGIQNGIAPSDGATLSQTHSDMVKAGETDADAWKLNMHTITSPNKSFLVEERDTAEYGLNIYRPMTKGRSSPTIDETGVVDSKPRKSTLTGLGRMILSRPTYVTPLSSLAIPFYY